MHTVSEYSDLLRVVLAQAEQMTARFPPIHRKESNEVLSFLKTYGCEGYPTNREKDFNIGPWLAQQGTPSTQRNGIAIVPCFSDDVPPATPSSSCIFGQCFHTDQVVILYDVDYWSHAELALFLLHEGRHARHRIGPRLAQLPPLDQTNDLHETNTWIFTLNILTAWGGKTWDAAVQREIAWLMQQNPKTDRPGQILCHQSPYYWPELDQVFGPTCHESVHLVRRSIVSLQANMMYWSQRDSTLKPEQVCHSLVKHFYS